MFVIEIWILCSVFSDLHCKNVTSLHADLKLKG